MIKIDLSSVKPGMRLAKSVYTDGGKLLIDNGVTLKENYIDKLKSLGYANVYVAWGNDMSDDCSEIFLEDTRKEAITLVKEALVSINPSKHLKIDSLKELVANLAEDLLQNKSTRVYLTDIRAIDEYTFGHSVNVCVFSLMMGILLDMNKSELVELGIGALLHDIGKITISKDVLNKPASLEPHEYEVIKEHPTNGYRLMQQIHGVSDASCAVVRDHHERVDGNGYPQGLKGEEIHLFARIVAICDVYDALTSNRVYKSKIPPHYAIEYLISMGNHQFDYELVKVFLKNIDIYPLGSTVKLESGETGVVVGDNIGWPTRPIIEIQYTPTGDQLVSSKKIDLKQQLNYSIATSL